MAGRPGTDAGAGLILVAAGRGTRLGAGMPKALVPLGHGRQAAPVVVHALRAALRCRALASVVVVAPPDEDGMQQLAAAVRTVDLPAGVEVTVVAGGAERSDSVALGLRALPPDVGVVLVHDAARALTPVEVFDRVVEAVRSGHHAVTPALPVADTVKQVTADAAAADGLETVVATLDRSALRAVQTPQGFRREVLEGAHAEIEHAVTDDCGMVESLGGTVTVVAGSARAMKVTTPHDLELAAAWLAEDHGSRVGRGVRAPGPLVVVLSGRPGVGKTAVSRELCRRLGAVHLRVDTIEQGLVRGGLPEAHLFAQGYGAAYEVAADQLAVGLPVVADMVNGVVEAREEWERVAREAGVPVLRVLVECSDADEHRRRVETRPADIAGHTLPDWEQSRTREVAPWPEADLRVDTAAEGVEEIAARIADAVARVTGTAAPTTQEASR